MIFQVFSLWVLVAVAASCGSEQSGDASDLMLENPAASSVVDLEAEDEVGVVDTRPRADWNANLNRSAEPDTSPDAADSPQSTSSSEYSIVDSHPVLPSPTSSIPQLPSSTSSIPQLPSPVSSIPASGNLNGIDAGPLAATSLRFLEDHWHPKPVVASSFFHVDTDLVGIDTCIAEHHDGDAGERLDEAAPAETVVFIHVQQLVGTTPEGLAIEDTFVVQSFEDVKSCVESFG